MDHAQLLTWGTGPLAKSDLAAAFPEILLTLAATLLGGAVAVLAALLVARLVGQTGLRVWAVRLFAVLAFLPSWFWAFLFIYRLFPPPPFELALPFTALSVAGATVGMAGKHALDGSPLPATLAHSIRRSTRVAVLTGVLGGVGVGGMVTEHVGLLNRQFPKVAAFALVPLVLAEVAAWWLLKQAATSGAGGPESEDAA